MIFNELVQDFDKCLTCFSQLREEVNLTPKKRTESLRGIEEVFIFMLRYFF